MNKKIRSLESYLSPLIVEIATHPIFNKINDLPTLKYFMQQHVFAVWDFVCLLKKLYSGIVTTTVPWYPPKDPLSAHLISEILMEEESDLSSDGKNYLSHFEMYLQAMGSIGADTSVINNFIFALSNGSPIDDAIKNSSILESTKQFIRTTFSFFDCGIHEIAAAFVFGREAITSSMFIPLVKELKENFSKDEIKALDPLIFYLDRHIELDDGEHLPKSLKMISNLAENDNKKWDDIKIAAKKALISRINFLNGIQQGILTNQGNVHLTTLPQFSGMIQNCY